MDNDNKIEKKGTKKIQRHDEVLLFLDEELKNLKKGSNKDVYDIKKEYAKTAKNKSPFTHAVLFATAVVVFIVALTMSIVIKKQNQQIKVQVEVFDDLNLRDLLDTVSKSQSEYDNAVKNKATLESTQTRLIKEAEAKRDNDLFVLDTLKLSKAEYEKRGNAIRSECNSTISSIQAEYAPQIAEMDSQIDVYQKRMSEYDTAKVQQAQEQEKALNSERQLRQLEQKELTSRYETQIADLQKSMDNLRVRNQEAIRKSVKEVQTIYQAEIDRLDPVVKDPAADSIVQNTKQNYVTGLDSAGLLALASEDAELTESVKTYQKYYEDFEYLNKKVAAVPQKNTIPSYVKANSQLVKEMGQTFADTTKDLYNKNAELERQLSETKKQTEVIYSGLLTTARSNALVSTVLGENDIQVFIAERARYLVNPETGVNAEFTVGKTVVKGRVKIDEDGCFRFYMPEDEEGNVQPLPVEVSAVIPGTLVKLISK